MVRLKLNLFIVYFFNFVAFVSAQENIYFDQELERLNNKAFLQVQSKPYYEAITTIEDLTKKATLKNNTFYLAASYNVMALAYMQHHNYQKAAISFKKAIKLNSKLNEKTAVSLNYANLAHCYMLNSDNENYGNAIYQAKVHSSSKSKYYNLETEVMWFYQNGIYDSLVNTSSIALKDIDTNQIPLNPLLKERLQITFELYLAYGLIELNKNIDSANAYLDRNKNKELAEILWFSPRVYEHYYKIYSYKSKIILKKNSKQVDSIYYYQKLADQYFKKTTNLIEQRSANNTNQLSDILHIEKEIENLKIIGKSKEKESLFIKRTNWLLLIIGSLALCFLGYFVLVSLKMRKINVALDQTNTQLYNSIDNRDKFLAVISHEIRTPLYSLQEIISKERFKQDDDIKLANYSLVSLKHTINNAFQYSRLAYFDNKINVDAKFIRLDEFLNNLQEYFAPILLEKAIQLQFKLDLNNVLFELPENKMKLVINNLVKNALDKSDVSLIIITITEKSIDELKIALNFNVYDNGKGISQEMISYVNKGDINIVNENNNQGMKLGLILSNNILSFFNSKLVFSPSASSNVVSFMLNNIATKPISVAVTKATTNKSVLFVDDNKMNLLITKKILISLGHHCTTINNGIEAIELVKKESFDFILMDINMPIMDGYATTLEIRKFNSEIPIFAYTALSEDEISTKCIGAGICDILTKPLSTREFKNFIDKL